MTTPSGAEANDRAEELVAVFFARQMDDVAIGGDDFECGTAVARLPLWMPEPWVAVAMRPATEMCGSEARLCNAIAARVDDGSKFAVGDAGADGHGARLVVDGDLVEVFERDLILVAVGDGIEGVAGAERAKLAATLDD